MKTQEPMLVVFAGPNGSGKSSVTNVLYERNSDLPFLYINDFKYKKILFLLNLSNNRIFYFNQYLYKYTLTILFIILTFNIPPFDTKRERCTILITSEHINLKSVFFKIQILHSFFLK